MKVCAWSRISWKYLEIPKEVMEQTNAVGLLTGHFTRARGAPLEHAEPKESITGVQEHKCHTLRKFQSWKGSKRSCSSVTTKL